MRNDPHSSPYSSQLVENSYQSLAATSLWLGLMVRREGIEPPTR
jgi:hypothetical protein